MLKQQHRQARGSMILLMSLTIGLVVLVVIAGIILNVLLFQSNRSQHKADSLALSLASKINTNNRVGQMNELEDRCRELVYVSRTTEMACGHADFGYLSALSQQLLREAREGQQLVECERKNQIRLITKDIQDAVEYYNLGSGALNSLALQWLKTYEPRVTNVAMGTIKNVQSNVVCQRVFRGLARFDFHSRYFSPANGGLYYANTNAKLPTDRDLDFHYSALPAATNGIVAQPRNTNPDAFMAYGNIVENCRPVPNSLDKIPCAVQVSFVMDANVGPDKTNKTALNLIATGITTGASPEPGQ